MTKLNCEVGQIAITVKAHNPENLGKIVEIIDSIGYMEWSELEGMQWVWICRSSGEASMAYLLPDGTKSYESQGLVPDQFLRPITPPGHADTMDQLTDIAFCATQICSYENDE